MPTNNKILALDVGTVRIGVAMADSLAQLPAPLATLDAGPGIMDRIAKLIQDESVSEVIVGLPRNLSGNSTPQTKFTEEFAEQLKKAVNVPVRYQDEALTSNKAADELKRIKRPKPHVSIDSLAAAYILEDYLSQKLNKGVNHE